MSHVPRMYAARLALTTTAALAALAGCGQPEPAPSDNGTVSVPVQPTLTLDTPTTDVVDTTAPGLAGGFDLSAQLTTDSCAATDGSWSYRGRLSNPTSSELRATVAISLVNSTDMSIATTKEVDVVVPAGQTVRVEAVSFYDSGDAGANLACVTGASDKEG